MARSGAIRAEESEHRIDRRGETRAVWEKGVEGSIDLPWSDATTLQQADVKPLLAGARTVVLAVGNTPVSKALLATSLDAVPPTCRLYVYADRSLEADPAFVQKLSRLQDRVLARLGHRIPGDWLVVDAGRTGRLVIGANAEHRRWVIPVDGALARSLFEAFRMLFWFHAVREALPDEGAFAFHQPLAAPFASPGTDVSLAAGRLVIGGALPDPVPDAEIRITPRVEDPGPAKMIFVPPTEPNGRVAPCRFDLPAALVQRGSRVVWSDTGLPNLTVTRQRMVLTLAERPIALQLEWPQAAAIDLFHRFERVAQRPTWEFHASRRLGDIRGPVLLEGSTQAADVVPSEPIHLGDIAAPLLGFDGVAPDLPQPPPLVLDVVFKWRRMPPTLPPGAREALVVRQWKAVDEWTTRQVDDLRTALNDLGGQDGLVAKLKRWLPSWDEGVRERRKLIDELDVLGESRPSELPTEAPERMLRLTQIAARIQELRRSAHEQRQSAEDSEAEEEQRLAWERRVEQAKEKFLETRQRLADNEQAHAKAKRDLEEAESNHKELVERLRRERTEALEADKVRLERSLEEAREELQNLDPNDTATKAKRKELGRQVGELERSLGQNRRDRQALQNWTPPTSKTTDVTALVAAARKEEEKVRLEGRRLESELKTHEHASSELFFFQQPKRLPAPALTELSQTPPIPNETPPELGELYEHQSQRFLAIRTWEQLARAEPVARRLRASLVVSAQPKS